MAVEKVYISGGGVAQAAFDAHTHNYRKQTELAVSVDHLYTTVLRYPVGDDEETVAIVGNNADLEAVGITVSTEPTGAPN